RTRGMTENRPTTHPPLPHPFSFPTPPLGPKPPRGGIPRTEPLQAARRDRPDPLPDVNRRSGGRAVLAPPVAAALRQADRAEDARRLHRGGRCRPARRAESARSAGPALLRLARRRAER